VIAELDSPAGGRIAAPDRRATVDLGAFRRNLRIVAENSAKPVPVALDLNAYGHGASAIARAAASTGVTIRFRGDESTVAGIGDAIGSNPIEGRRVTDVDETDEELAVFGIGGLALIRPELTAVMTLTAPIASIKRVGEDHGVSYGYTYRTRHETTLALVPIGYADGLPRSASNRGTIAVGGVGYRVAGRIAMDQCVLDVGAAPVTAGQTATIFGDAGAGYPRADDWADAAGINVADLVSRLGRRIRLVTIDGQEL
jgi:alanine racemase